MGKHPRIYKCSLCGEMYAVLNGTFHITPAYRMKFCPECTQIVERTIRKMRRAIRVESHVKNES